MLQIGEPCPQFSLPNQNSELFNSIDFLKKKILVIYFYPKDNTSGCTAEACLFRDNFDELQTLGCEVIGISSDSIKSHEKFALKHQLNFQLLSDTNKTARNLFKVPNSLFGLIPGRVTYIVNRKGTIEHVINNMIDTNKHLIETKKIVKKLNENKDADIA